MPAHGPVVVCCSLVVILEDTRICKVVGGANSQLVEIPRTSVANRETRKELAAQEVDAEAAGCQLLGSRGRVYSHRIPLTGLKCVSPKRRKEITAPLPG